jgi:hypothetical protein
VAVLAPPQLYLASIEPAKGGEIRHLCPSSSDSGKRDLGASPRAIDEDATAR